MDTSKEYNICNNCGKPFYNDGKTTAVPDLCKCQNSIEGWVCPVCGGGNSPYALRCPCTIASPNTEEGVYRLQ